MTSEDASSSEAAMKEADKYMKDHGIKDDDTILDTTRINKQDKQQSTYASEKEKEVVNCSPEDFMKAVEEDAKKRATENKRRKMKCEELKEMGNKSFKNQEYEEAIKFYTDAINEMKTNTAVYTNRAQANNKISRYEAAVEDCQTAIKIDKNCVKAYVHMGKGYLYMKEFDKATDTFQNAIKQFPKKETLLKGYLQEVDMERTKLLEESKAIKLIQDNNEEDHIIKSSIEILLCPGQTVNHYSEAALKLLNLIHNSTANKTSFRIHKGFDIYDKDDTSISRFWYGTDPCEDKEDIAMFCLVIDILNEAMTDNEYNVQAFVSVDHSRSFMSLLQEPTSPVIITSMIHLVYLLSQTTNGRKGLMSFESMTRILELLFIHINQGSTNSVVAMSTISNLAFEPKFCEKFRDYLGKEFLKISKMFLGRLCKVCTKGLNDISITWSLTSSGLSAMANMARDTITRELIAKDKDWLAACHRFMCRFGQANVVMNDSDANKVVFALLGLLTNLCSQADLLEEVKCHSLLPSLKDLLDSKDEDIKERCISVLRFLLAYSKESLNIALKEKIYVQFIDMLKSSRPVSVKYALKCLALCTSKDANARQAVLENQGLSSLVGLISSNNEIIIGNAALCLGDCAQIDEVCQQLVDTNIVQDLLRHATNDRLNQDVKRNAVLCLAKLATGDLRHREKLKDLHGLEILHSVFTKLS
ncbi:tetratricopeptide repeat protein 12-like [Actinia tenebrosa]|uniref:Protein unc-45 homolog B n=1 Tax=Actinia tenebrosa TaxID=6105 RepID=A0A6P8ISM2_ACTTE|nr:tetratricopeptide repeat protein 12-like [Actinia tenebrosa]